MCESSWRKLARRCMPRFAAPLLFTLTLALLFALWPHTVYADTIMVDGTVCTLPEAIEAANTDLAFDGCTTGGGTDTLVLTAPMYSLTTNFVEPNSDGLSATPSVTTTMIISAGVDGVTVARTGVTEYRLFHVGTAGNLTLIGVTIQNGNVKSAGGVLNRGGGVFNRGQATLIDTELLSNQAERGGGLYNNGTVTLTTVTMFDNRATTMGGGLFNNNNGKVATLISSGVISNSAGLHGGAIYNNNNGSTVTVSNTLVLSNSAGVGGGFYVNNNGSQLFVTNSEVRSNRATTHGGAFYVNSDSRVLLANTDVLLNTANGSGGGFYMNNNSDAFVTDAEVVRNRANSQGGAFYAVSSVSFAITDTSVLTNSAGNDGGGFYLGTDSSTIMTATLLNGNVSGSDGGAIFSMLNSGTTIVLTNGEVFSNSATATGGGIVNGSNATITNSPVISNSAGGDGGGIYAFFEGSTTLINSDLMRNRSGGDGGAISSSNNTTLTDSDVISNTAQGQGGGIYRGQGGNSGVTLNNSDVIANYAMQDGGGIASFRLTKLTDSDVISNTSQGSGGGLYVASESSAKTELSNVNVISNTAAADGGGIYSGDDAVISNSTVLSNTAGGDGGGIFSDGPANLSNLTIAANYASSRGGGLFNSSSSNLTLTDVAIRANTAITNGGGILNNGIATLTSVDIISNTAHSSGGGFYNNNTATFTGTQVISNSAALYGGGIYITANGLGDVTNTDVIANHAGIDGGGILNNNTAIISNTQVLSNTAMDSGGGIKNSGALTMTLAYLLGNQATFAGGGFYQDMGQTKITQTRIVANGAGDSGGALQFDLGSATINQSCIVANSDLALNYLDSGTIDAQNNWWGAADGPSGAGLGAGDSITNSVTYMPFEISALFDCTSRSTDLDFSKSAAPSVDLLPGQPLTFTLIITNNDTLHAQNLHVVDTLPAAFQLSEVISTGATISHAVGGFRVSSLGDGESATLYLIGTISSTLNADLSITNTATVSNSLSGVLTATTAANIIVPRLRWSQADYSAAEASGLYTATVIISPTNPYAAATAQATITAAVTITVSPGASSESVGVPIVDDAIVQTRTIPLTLLSAIGAAIDDQGGDQATLTLIEDDAAPALAVDKRANESQAFVGETITYTYRITNTGNVSLTVASATDDKLGALAGLTGQLALAETRAVTVPYVVQAGDLPGPLVNVVTVSATDMFANVITPTATYTFTPIAPTPALAVDKRANTTLAFVGETITYTYRITNTGNITLSTVSAVDDRLGTLTGLSGQLGLLETRAVTVPYVVQAGDLPGPLVNTVTVDGTDYLGNDTDDDDTVSVALATQTIQLTKHASPAGVLLPGQPLTYTIRVTNTDPATLDDLYITDPLPAHFVLSSINTTGPAISVQGSSYIIPHLLGSQVATIAFVGAVDATPTSDFTLTNSATLTNALIGQLTAAVSNNVVVPRVNWSKTDYSADETSGTFTATLLLSPTNPYGSVSVNVITTDSTPAAFQAAFQAEAVQTITFPPNSGSQPVVIDIVNDSAVLSRTITLYLQTLSGAALGAGASGNFASIHIVEDDAVPAIAVSVSVTPTQAMVGDTITYTYRITNTGNVTFATISALATQTGAVDDLTGELAPNATRTATVTYVVLQSDLPGPLVNTLDVTATDIFATAVTGDASTSVSVSAPTALPRSDQPDVPDQRTFIFLPHLESN